MVEKAAACHRTPELQGDLVLPLMVDDGVIVEVGPEVFAQAVKLF